MSRPPPTSPLFPYTTLFRSRYAFRLSGSAADAEDLTQEAFCKAQLRFHQLRDPARAKPWLFSILRNAYLHRVRTDAHHKKVDRKSTRLNSSHMSISYAVFCL